MGRIRLQIQVMPWAQEQGQSFTSQTRPDEVDKFCEPCDEGSTVQELADKVYARWARVNPGIELNIRHLESYFNEPLDMSDKVGDIFDDRNPGPNGQMNETSIVKVLRYPPTQREIQTPHRFASLMPESTARPLKRLPSMMSQESRVEQGYVGIHEQWRQPHETFGTASKRRRVYEGARDPDQPMQSSEERADRIYYSLQPSGTQLFRPTIQDSQRSDIRKNANPYGTPTSLSLISPQQPIPADRHNSSEIPDSPNGRINPGALEVAVEIEEQSTRSESPELGESVDAIPPTDLEVQTAEQIYIDVPASDPTTIPPVTTLIAKRNPPKQSADDLEASDGGITPRRTKSTTTPLQRSSKRKYPSVDATWAETRRQFDGLRRPTDDLDPIESDGEYFGQQQHIENGAGRKVDLGTAKAFLSPRAPASADNQRDQGNFFVQVSPQSRSSEARAPIGDVATPLLDGILTQAGEAQDPEAHSPHGHQRPHKQSSEMETEAQVPAHALKNQGQSTRVRVDLRNQCLANGAEEQKQQRAIDIKDKQQRLSDEAIKRQEAAKETEKEAGPSELAQKEDAEREFELSRLAEERTAKEEKNRIEKQAEAERMRQVRAEKDHTAKARAKEQEAALKRERIQEREETERLVHQQQAREKALEEQAEKVLQAEEGAKQLQAERLKKTRSTPTSNRKVGTSATSKIPITYARTDQQKARRRELDEKRKADKAKAADDGKEREAAKAQKSAQKLANSIAKEVANAKEGGRIRAATDKQHEETTTLTEKSPAKAILRKLGSLASERSRQSSSPSERNEILDQRRKSMTPAIPRTSATRPSSAVRENLLSSSPLASRSSRNGDASLRNTREHSNSALGRSVSLNNDPEPTLPVHLPAVTSNGYGRRPVKTLIEINKELVDAYPDVSQTSKLATKSGVSAPSSRTPASKAKVQTKLNVVRDKKMKGRDVGPLLPTKLPLEGPVVQSSSEGDDVWSVSFSDKDPQKAGPSSKTGSSSSVKEMEGPVLAISNIDPALQIIKTEKDTVPSLSSSSCSSRSTKSSSQSKSISRSPAHAISGARSQTSDSSSNSELGSASESDSTEESTEQNNNSESGNTARVIRTGIARAIRVEVSSSSSTCEPQSQALQQSKAVRTHAGPAVVNGSIKDADQSVGKLLKHESRESTLNDAKKVTTPVEGPADQKFPPLNRHGRLPNGTRPANYKYPTLTQLKKTAESNEPYQTPSQQVERQATRQSEPTSSSDGESSIPSDDDQDSNAAVSLKESQTSTRSKSGRLFAGVKSAINLARGIPGARNM